MGAGIFGLAIAWTCLGRGASVRVIDPAGPGGGASGGLLGALAPHAPENWNATKQVQFESLIAAEQFWAEIETTSGLSSGYGRTGRLQPVRDNQALAWARARAKQATRFWRGEADWSLVPAKEAGAWAPASPTGWLIRDTLSARLHPRRACASLAAAIRARGGRIVAEGSPRAPVIWATGYRGLLELSGEIGKPVGGGVKGQAALLTNDARDLPQIFAQGIHIVPHDDGTIAVGSTDEREFGDERSTDEALDRIIGVARAACPVLEGARVMERWAGVRPRARSRAPILGTLPGRKGHFIANGGFKTGFGMAPAIARMMADLVLEGRDCIPAPFRIEASFQRSGRAGGMG